MLVKALLAWIQALYAKERELLPYNVSRSTVEMYARRKVVYLSKETGA